MRIAIGCDHGGIVLKPAIIGYLSGEGIECIDVGCNSTESVDYPVYAKLVGTMVANNEADKGILLCGTGIGISIAANKIKGIRAAVVTNEFCAEKCAEHNDANIICLGGRVVTPDEAIKIVAVWLNSKFEGGRHQKRIQMIKDIEDEN